ncbi:hypothetical protein H0H93_010754, partial [Arthromyces matolae]
MKYPPDKPGEEHMENARVWNVFLDETESHDRDLLQGFRDIIDGVLVFASLFSAVVTTLVAQTSQVLQPDNTQIMASILFENNQLLRAAGNVTAINTVPKSTLSPGSVVHTTKDVWVNGLFFTSLGLSLTTALLTVLVKQWLHSIRYCPLYLRTYIVSGILLARDFIPSLLWNICERNKILWTWLPSRQSLELAETEAIQCNPYITLDILQQLLQTSNQRSTRQIILDAAFAILQECELPMAHRRSPFIPLFQPFLHALMEEILVLSLDEHMSTIKGDGSQVEKIANTWEQRIASLNERIQIDGRKKIEHFFAAFRAADLQDNRHSCECILDWIGKPALQDASNTSDLLKLMVSTTGNGIRQILKRTGTGILSELLWTGTPLLYRYATVGNLDQVKAVVEAGSDEVVNYVSSASGRSPLDGALFYRRCEIVSYLMDHGGRAREDFYEAGFFIAIVNSNWDMVKLLWRRRRE